MVPHLALKKCKSKNRFRKSVDMIYSIWCILSLFITNTDYCIWLNQSNMIVHNLGRKKDILQYFRFLIVTSWWNVTSSEKYKNHGFVFAQMRHKSWRQNVTETWSSRWYVVQQRRYCRPRKITKDYSFFF